jgi:hypothetical protein
MGRLTFLELAKKVIEEEKKPLAIEEIWETALKKGYDKDVETKGKTPWRTIGAQIYLDILKGKSSFIKIGTRPRRFYLKTPLLPVFDSKDLQGEIIAQPEKMAQNKYIESELHPFLTSFVMEEFKAVTKSIHETSSKKGNKGENKWSHPDIVGCYFPESWNSEESWAKKVEEFREKIDKFPLKLYSFELKVELNFGNIKEAFFQCVSNSSWAHEGFLVTSKIEEDSELMQLISRLSDSFGIGIIQIDVNEPDKTKIVIPAKTREYLNWASIENFASINRDFEEFIDTVIKNLRAKEVAPEKYNKYKPLSEIKLKDQALFG